MTAPSMGAIAPDVLVNGSAMSEVHLNQLTGLRIRTALGLPGRATLRFDDIGYAIAAGNTFAIGAPIEVQMAQGQTLFSGEVTGIDLQLDQGVPDFVVIADDLSYKMALGNRVETYTQMTFSDMVRKIGGRSGLSVNADSTTIQFEYTMQTDSDFGFLSEIADRTGYDWWVEGRTLSFKKPNPAATGPILTVGEDLRQFSVRASALHPSTTSVTGWSPKQKQATVGKATASEYNVLPTANLVSGYAKVASLNTSGAVTSSTDAPIGQEEATELAKRAVTSWATAAVVARGTTLANSSIKIGGSVQVAGAGPANGKYFVTEVEHSYSDRGFETRFTAGDRRPNGLVDTLTAQKQSSFRRDGLVVGVVTAIGNTQGSPGDIKIKYPGVSDTLESAWARILSVGGGQKKGITFMPEVNDEVVVGFENGDPRRPVILGALFNGKDVQPAFLKTGSQVDSRQITSRLGHAMEFGDGTAPDKKYISLTLAGHQSSVMLSDKEFAATVPAGHPVSITSGSASFKIDAQGGITISGSKITLKADTDVEISGLNVTTKASVKSSTSAAMVEVKANATLDMSASGPSMLKGNPVMIN
ncbi:phage protein D [Nakamurella sp. UYEF19]|uniref:phage baseplate assembly protein V n=1 Tax=Nakamurella sp. UYEF19 TaxID=1756392 RepID=UPI0033949909